MFSKTCEYAIKIMIYVTAQEKKTGLRIGLNQITEGIDSPRAFTAKILQQLVRAGLLESLRGKTGGFSVPKRKSITLGDIVQAIDGDRILKGCVLGFKECSAANPCPVHFKFASVRDYLGGTLASVNIDDLDEGLLALNTEL